MSNSYWGVHNMVMQAAAQAAAAKAATPIGPAAPPTTSTATLGKRRLPTGALPTSPSTKTPCENYEAAKRMGQSAAIVNALKAKCDAYNQAVAFAQDFASAPAPAAPGAAPGAPLNMPVAAVNPMAMATAEDPILEEGMSKNKKLLLIGGGVAGVALLGFIIWKAKQ